eukprot:3514921-Prymnesium_polylepis.1
MSSPPAQLNTFTRSAARVSAPLALQPSTPPIRARKCGGAGAVPDWSGRAHPTGGAGARHTPPTSRRRSSRARSRRWNGATS